MSSRHAAGVVARREGYRHGALAWAQEDRNLDGQPDRWETWTSGALRRVVIAAPGGRGRALRVEAGRAPGPAGKNLPGGV